MGVPFSVGVTRDIRTTEGGSVYPLTPLANAEEVSWEFVREDAEELLPTHVEGFDAVIVFGARVTSATLDCPEPPVLFARLGVGYDTVDVAACTAGGALVTITPDGVRRPMAAGAMAFLLALAHRLTEKDRLVRSGSWDRFACIGTGLTGRTLGILGLGNIGRDLCRLAEPFGLRRIACDPFVEPFDGVSLVDLERLLRESDFVCVTLPLTAETYHLLDAERLALMKPGAYVINVARGPIVDQQALSAALAKGQLAGAALDVFEEEPLDATDPLLQLGNVVVAPHAIGLTDELFAESARSACESVLAVAEGRAPHYIVNPEALEHPRLRTRLRQ
jgi:phosphoglycerate dehydrogenase-like enzyme